MLGLGADAKPLQTTNSQVLSGENVGTAQRKLQVPDQREVQQESQRRRVCEPDGQVVIVAALLDCERQDGFTAAHQVGQTVITIPDVRRAAALPNGVFLRENQRAVLLSSREAVKCKDAQCTDHKEAAPRGGRHSCLRVGQRVPPSRADSLELT